MSSRTILLYVTALVCASCRHEDVEPHRSDSPPPNEVWIAPDQIARSGITIEAVGEHPIDDTVIASGRVTFDDARVDHVFSPVAGRITQIRATLGQTVRKGDPLAIIQSPDIGSASSDVGKAQADLNAADHSYRRQQRLLDQGASSQSDFETAQDNYERAKAELDRATQRSFLMGASGGVTQSFTLRASIDGDVVARAVAPGMEVQSQYSVGSAVELFTIGTIDRVWILADIYEIDAERVRPGDVVHVNVVAVPNRVFDGFVDYVGEMLDPATRTLKVRCALENGDHALKPEMYATVKVLVDARQRLSIPRAAVLRLGDQSVAFVDKGAGPNGVERFLRVPVTVDERSASGLVPVEHGLAAGDRIAVDGAQMLSSLL